MCFFFHFFSFCSFCVFVVCFFLTCLVDGHLFLSCCRCSVVFENVRSVLGLCHHRVVCGCVSACLVFTLSLSRSCLVFAFVCRMSSICHRRRPVITVSSLRCFACVQLCPLTPPSRNHDLGNICESHRSTDVQDVRGDSFDFSVRRLIKQ